MEDVKFLGSIELAKSCQALIEKNKGKFQSKKQKYFIFGRVNKFGLPVVTGDEKFWKKIMPSIVCGDKVVILKTQSNSKNKTWYDVYILDDEGVRVHFEKHDYWKRMASNFTFRKDKWKDTAERRREHNVGLGPDLELVHGEPKMKFVRK